MRTLLSVVSIATVSIFLGVATAGAGSQCGTRQDILTQLATKYHEQPVALGLINSAAMLEILRSEDGTTWTAVVTSADGMTCYLTSGESWQDLYPVWDGLEDPA